MTTPLLLLAEAIADGKPVDWEKAASELGEGHRDTLGALREIETLTAFVRSRSAKEKITAQPGGAWGHLQLREPLGTGSFGTVWRAYDPKLEREVALKLLKPHDGTRHGLEVALREGRLLARVRHPNVASVYGAEERDGTVGIWMELVEGRTLQEMVRADGPMSPGEAAGAVREVCRAVAAVHKQDIIHRDIKAHNVLRETGGRIVLVDFGIGLDAARSDPRRDLAGTPRYLAPEILDGGPPSPQSDTYALGVLLFFLATGRYPVEGDSLDEIRRRHHEAEIHNIRDLRPDVLDGFARLIDRALAAAPRDRFATVGDLDRELGRFGPDRVPRLSRRYTLLAVAGLAVLLALVALLNYTRPEARARRLLAAAQQARARTDLDTARAKLRAAVEIDPDLAVAYAYLSLVGGGSANPARAEDHAQDGISRLLKSTSAQERAFVEAARLLSEPARREALDMFGQAAALDDESEQLVIDSLQQMTMLHQQLGEPQEAANVARRALELNPSNILSLDLSVTALAELGDGYRALELLPDSVANCEAGEFGGELHLLWGAGLARFANGDLALARQCFEALEPAGGEQQSNSSLLVVQLDLHDAFARLEGADLLGRLREIAGNAGAALLVDLSKQADTDAVRKSYSLARIELFLGERQRALSLAEELADVAELPLYLKRLRLAIDIMMRAGAREGTEALAMKVERVCQDFEDSLCQAVHLQALSAIARIEGHHEKALRLLTQASGHWNDDLTRLNLVEQSRMAGREDLAAAFAEDVTPRPARFLNEGLTINYVEAVAFQDR